MMDEPSTIAAKPSRALIRRAHAAGLEYGFFVPFSGQAIPNSGRLALAHSHRVSPADEQTQNYFPSGKPRTRSIFDAVLIGLASPLLNRIPTTN
jgi:hypothetical protein